MHARPRRDSWATFLRLSYARAKSEFLTLSNWDQPAKGDNPDRKTLVLQNGWGLGVGLTPPCKTIIVTKPSKERPKPTPGCSAEEEEEEE
jgi:hypothetical protein